MARLRDMADIPPASPAIEVRSAKARGAALSDAAAITKRSADALLESEEGRDQVLAGFSAFGGLLALTFGLFIVLGAAQPEILAILAAVSVLAPTGYALMNALGTSSRMADASYDRGFCQALANQAKRLSDAAGSKDQYNVPLGPAAVIAEQLDLLHKDFDRARQRLRAFGADPLQATAANLMQDRVSPLIRDTVMTVGDGRRFPVRIADLSLVAVALRGSLPPLTRGEQVTVGTRRAVVVKLEEGKAALQFQTPILPTEFNPQIVL